LNGCKVIATGRVAGVASRGIAGHPPQCVFFEWKAIKGQKAKQPYAIAMKDGAPFGIAGIWEKRKDPAPVNGLALLRSSRRMRTSS
jgi:hypothetical protein